MTNLEPLEIKQNPNQITIEGVRYANALFTELGIRGIPEGATFRLLKREDGVLTLQRIDATRIKIGPLELACKKCGNKDTFTLDLENPATAAVPERKSGR